MNTASSELSLENVSKFSYSSKGYYTCDNKDLNAKNSDCKNDSKLSEQPVISVPSGLCCRFKYRQPCNGKTILATPPPTALQFDLEGHNNQDKLNVCPLFMFLRKIYLHRTYFQINREKLHVSPFSLLFRNLIKLHSSTCCNSSYFKLQLHILACYICPLLYSIVYGTYLFAQPFQLHALHLLLQLVVF